MDWNLKKRFGQLLFGLGGLMTQLQGAETPQNLSHAQWDGSFQISFQKLVDKIERRGDLPNASKVRQLELLNGLTQFDLGRFLIERGGLNGYWTDYIANHPCKGGPNRNKALHPIESFLLNQAPIALAMQHRYQIFKAEIQKRVKEGCRMGSVPSGLLGDFLELDYSQAEHFSLYGIDLDPESFEQAASLAKERWLLDHCTFLCQNAWTWESDRPLDLIISNGLNFYEPDDGKVVALYRRFYEALKSNGCLITSFLSLPPAPGMKTEWDLSKVNLQDAAFQKILLFDILEGRWQVFRSEQTMKEQLQAAGFEQIEVIYDTAHIFPTIIATK
jgi:hypothetical protein